MVMEVRVRVDLYLPGTSAIVLDLVGKESTRIHAQEDAKEKFANAELPYMNQSSLHRNRCISERMGSV